MDDAVIDKFTTRNLSLNTNPKKLSEFLCACANAKAITENKQAEQLKTTIMKAQLKSVGLGLSKLFENR